MAAPPPAIIGPTHPSLQTSREPRRDCALTRKERALLGLLALIRNKPSWHTHIRNPDVIATWKTEFHAVAKHAATAGTVPYDRK
ncbi:hypothetical protein HDU86_006843, partial [Geranomyces michiganensis]